MQHSLRYVWYRTKRLTPHGAAAAMTRRGGAVARRWAAEASARLLGTRVGDGDLRRALRGGSGNLRSSRFFLEVDDRERLVGRIRAEYPEAVPVRIQAAEAICAHSFDLLGSGSTALGPEIDWHRDFKSGHRWAPRTFFTRVRYGEVAGVDVKVPWELSRFQHLPTLGQAYWYTGDGRYAAEFVAQISHWIARNPPQFGVNWACPMDIAIRAFNWLWGAAFFRSAPEATPTFWRELARSLLAHGRHVLKNLERGADGITSNHYLANLVGLFGLGLGCPFFREAATWRDLALEEIQREVERQVHPDGGDYESSIPYHRLVVEMFLAVAILCERNGLDLPEGFRQRLEGMLEFTLWYTKPNGLAPQVGDNDDGRLHILADYGRWDPRDHRHVLATGGICFERDDFCAAGAERAEESLWLTGRWRAVGRSASSPSLGSRAFCDTGVYLMREEGLYLLIACGAVGTRGIGNHKHNDALSFELHADGQDLLVDPGSYLYTPEPMWRNRFRSTAVHNTVMVDEAEQNRFGEGGLFWLHADAIPRCIVWEAGPEEDLFVGEHDGYARLADPVTHRREIRLQKRAQSITIVDQFRGSGRHALTWNFTLAPDVTLRPAGEARWELVGPSARALFRLERMKPGVTRELIRPEVVESWVSPRYGVKEKSSALRFHLTSGLPLECRFQIEVH